MTTRSEDQVVATGEGPAQKVRTFLSRYFRNQELRDDEDMFAKKIINSVAAMDLVLFIEKQFSIKLEPGDLKLDNFRTIGAIVAMIERKTQSHAA
jgi:acyl carrier protein